VRCADGMALRNHVRCPRTGAQMLAELKALASENVGVVSLVDIIGAQRQVLVLPPVSEQEAQHEGDLPREILATVRMAVVEIAEPVLLSMNLRISGAVSAGAVPTVVPTVIGKTVADDYITVHIDGTAATYGILTINGPITGLKIENLTTGHKLELPGITIAQGDWYQFDMRSRIKTVTDSNGADRSSQLSADSDLNEFVLVAGENHLHISGAATNQYTEGMLQYLPKDA